MTDLRELIARAYCCGDAACYNESCGVPCAAEKISKVADAILAALDTAGLVVVPKEPTTGMTEAIHPNSPCKVGKGGAATWRTMLAAIPYVREKTDDHA